MKELKDAWYAKKRKERIKFKSQEIYRGIWLPILNNYNTSPFSWLCLQGGNVWKFVKELMILFHRILAAPWSHMVSTIKKELQQKILPLFATPTAVSNRSICSSPWRQTYLVLSTSQDPRATNAHAELKGTGHTAKFQQAFYLQNLTLPYLITLSYN